MIRKSLAGYSSTIAAISLSSDPQDPLLSDPLSLDLLIRFDRIGKLRNIYRWSATIDQEFQDWWSNTKWFRDNQGLPRPKPMKWEVASAKSSPY